MDVMMVGFRAFQSPLLFQCCQCICVFIAGSCFSLSLLWDDGSDSSYVIG